jgi:hypothetical protein
VLTIYIRDDEVFDEATNEFVEGPVIAELQLEHSLVSLSKWEQKFEKPFLGAGEKSDDEVLAYIEAMILDPNFSPEVFSKLSQNNINQINDYINASSTATWFSNDSTTPRSREVITSELIYYWMISFNIPFECQYWHLNRLFTLIRVCNVKNQKPRKMSRAEQAAQMRKLNAERKVRLGTTG